MTMTSMAVAPGSLGAPPAMLAPKVYPLQQQGLAPNTTYSASGKNQDTLRKGKKSWSVRLGLTRHVQNHYDESDKGWGTVSGGSALSRQMVYADPWLYGTVRSSRPLQEHPRALLTGTPPPTGGIPPPVCSCPEFLAGTVRKQGNCHKCGGRRTAGVPIGGTCRLPPTSSRSRPSLAGVLRPSSDDPYDLMRRYRLVEPRSRARSTSPLRLGPQRDGRSQSIVRSGKDRSVASTDVPFARSSSEWHSNDSTGNHANETIRSSRLSFTGVPDGKDEWLDDSASGNHQRGAASSIGRVYNAPRKSRDVSNDWQTTSSTPPPSDTGEEKSKNAGRTNQWKEESSNSASDSRKSILECDVNPYLLLKKQKDEDDSSDDLSDNALERDAARHVSSLFDPTKVKSIERIPNRSAFAAIGGQRIRVFNEPRNISDDEDVLPISRIPIPKVSPKRPPRRLKDTRQTLKSILKRGKVLHESRRKNVLFNVDNVIFAPEKPSNSITSTWAKIGKLAKDGFSKDWRGRGDSDETVGEMDADREVKTKKQEALKQETMKLRRAEEEEKRRKEEEEETLRQQERHKFIMIPNIKDPKVDKMRTREGSKGPGTRTDTVPSIAEATRSEKPAPANKPSDERVGDKRNSGENARKPIESRLTSRRDSVSAAKVDRPEESSDVKDTEERRQMETEDEAEPMIQFNAGIAVDEKDLILKTEETFKKSFLSRSQSDRTFIRSQASSENVQFTDTMRLGLSRKIKYPALSTSVEDCGDSKGVETELKDNEEIKADNSSISETSKTVTASEVSDSEVTQPKMLTPSINCEPFRTMRPTSWSPPPLRQKHRQDKRMSDPSGSFIDAELSAKQENPVNNKLSKAEIACTNVESTDVEKCSETQVSESKTNCAAIQTMSVENEQTELPLSIVLSSKTGGWGSKEGRGFSGIEVNGSVNAANNVCKITVNPRTTSPMVHRLQVGPGSSEGARRTSILINGDQNVLEPTANLDNRVTISVGGEDSVCNPTVISVNSESPKPKIQSPVENRTLVILENHRSNIVVKSVRSNETSTSRQCVSFRQREVEKNAEVLANDSKSSGLYAEDRKQEKRGAGEKEILETAVFSRGISKQNNVVPSDDEFAENVESFDNDHYTTIRHVGEDSVVGYNPDLMQASIDKITRSACLEAKDLSVHDRPGATKEALISKLLGDSLKKARDKGEIPEEGSDETILKILKQSLLKGKEYESSESTIEANYSRSSSVNSVTDGDLVTANLFFDENPYEVIKEPIYEEIPDEPPPLPLSPPPTEDYMKGYLGEISYYKKIGSYLSDEVFGRPGAGNDLTESMYLSKSPEEYFKKSSSPGEEKIVTAKFELLNFLMDSKDRAITAAPREDNGGEEEDEEEDAERDLEALYEQKETSLGDLSSKSSQISNVSDSSEECNIILISSTEAPKLRAVDIERTDSGVGSESSQASSTRGIARRWRTGNVTSGPGSLLGGIPQVTSNGTKLCEDCEQRLDPLITDSGVVYAPFVCRKCSKKRAERKEIITEIVETEQKYGRDLHIILEEFHRPMHRAGLLTSEQLSAIFLNVEELLEHNLILAQKLKNAVERAQESGDDDLVTVDVGKIFLESERMLHAFESYCTRQGSASLLLQNLEKEKELLRIFLKVSQMENTVLRRMNLNSFLMVPVQRVTKYPLLLARLLKATPSIRPDIQEAKERLEQAQANIELHLEHMNAEAKDVTSTKLWRRISIIQNGRRPIGEQDMVNIKLRKMAVEVLEWAHEEARFVLEGRLLVAQPTDNNWRRGRTVKLAPVTAMLVTNGKANVEHLQYIDDSLFPKCIGIKEATLLLVKEKLGRYSLLREPLYLDKCIVCCETDLEDYFEIQELSSKETFIFKAEDGARTKRWCRTLQAHAQSLGAWRKRRGALPNIMICGVTRN